VVRPEGLVLFYLCQAQEEHAHLILFRDTVECAKARAQPRWAEVGGRGGRAEVGGHTRTWIRSDDPEKPIGRAVQCVWALNWRRGWEDCETCGIVCVAIAFAASLQPTMTGTRSNNHGVRTHPVTAHTLNGLVQCCKPTTQCSTRLCNECGEPVMSWSIKNTEHKGTRDSLFTYPHLRMGETH
jgi:hypothetical protein